MQAELSLFPEEEAGAGEPLASRLRPESLEEFVGHREVVGPSGVLSQTLVAGDPSTSYLFWGPPGSGKTTLANLVARRSGQQVHLLSAVTAGLKELREVFDLARRSPGRHLLFIDEIHRFNKAQQDALLPVLESGSLRLLGATTENPYFELRKALLSRCRVVRLEKLNHDDIVSILRRALHHPEGLARLRVEVEEECLSALAGSADGDARAALNLLELAVARGSYGSDGGIAVRLDGLQAILNDQNLAYHKTSDRRFDLVSAFIKSIRASKPDAALYWLASMLAGGEDPKYIFRRLLIAAAEDVGLAYPSAIAVVTSCATAFEWVGLPEGKYHLSQATLYLATANKSTSTNALFQAETHLKRHGPGEVPAHLRNNNSGAAAGRYLPEGIHEGSFYLPGNQGYESVIQKRLNQSRKA